VRTPEDLQRFIAWLDAFYDFFRSEIGGTPATWSEAREACLSGGPAPLTNQRH
jgi:hypothetical protein